MERAFVIAILGAESTGKTTLASQLRDALAAQSRDVAYQESLRAEGPAPVRRGFGEVQDDGSVRYGDVSVTVRNPCPPGTAHYDPTPLPGRRSK